MSEIRPQGQRLRLLFFALALLYVLPFWTVRYLPTVDGACHTYNAWIIRQYGNVEQYPLFQQYYEINTKPYPNWISQGTMALLMLAVPPIVAEKLLVSGYVLLFLGGVWYLAGAVRPEVRWPAFLAFPFAYHQLFQYGFYNFSVSLALFPWVLGYWWRHREEPGLGFAVRINLLLWLCYFSHILSFALALAAVGVLWLATLRRESWRRHLLHIPILLPQVVLPIWFFLQKTGGEIPDRWPVRRLLRYFANLQVLQTFGGGLQRWFALGLAILFLLLLVLTLGRHLRRPVVHQEDAFLLLAILFFVLYIFSPQGLAGGSLLKPRLSLYPYLLLIPWLSPGFSGKVRKAAAATLALAALLYLGNLTYWYRLRGGEVAQFLSALEPIRPNARIATLLFERTGPTDYLSHAIGYKALEKGLVDWDNYEAKHSFFPTRFRGSVVFPDLTGMVAMPRPSLILKPNLHYIDAVYTWKMPPGILLRKRLKRSYQRVSEGFGGELYEIRQDLPGIQSAHARPPRRRRDGPGAGNPGRGPRQDRARPRHGRPGRGQPDAPGGAVVGM
ncbi:MAG TPA: hypothetical protein VKK31_05715 [Thermoanaerobaculia bacterium]|nr:hypothetical protein [Thermoanaerobaculia bacterium]